MRSEEKPEHFSPKAGDSRTSSSGVGGGGGYLGSAREETEAGERQRLRRTGLLLPAFLLGSSRFLALCEALTAGEAKRGGRGAKKAGFAGKGENTASERARSACRRCSSLCCLGRLLPSALKLLFSSSLVRGQERPRGAHGARASLSLARRAGEFQAEEELARLLAPGIPFGAP